MAQLTAQIVSHDADFKQHIARLVRACGVPVGILEGRSGAEIGGPDLVVVDIRADAASGMAAIERIRAASANVAIFAVASAAEPDLILRSMRAGANEFFPWMPGGQTQASRDGGVDCVAFDNRPIFGGKRQISMFEMAKVINNHVQ